LSYAGNHGLANLSFSQRRWRKLQIILFLSPLGLLGRAPSLAAQAASSPAIALPTKLDTQPADHAPTLSLADAEAHALHNQPRLAAETLRAEAMGKRVQQSRSAYFPQLTGNLTAVKANGDTAVAAGAVTTSSTSTRVAGGFTLTQLVTDFGRTSELVRSSRLTALAASQHTEDVKLQILRDVDQAYFATEAAESVRGTAQAVLSFRQTSLRQLTALAQSQLRSTLDVQFAQVLVSEAQIAVVHADSAVQEARAQLAAAMGDDTVPNYVLVEQPQPPLLEDDVQVYIREAISTRPDLKALQLQAQAAQQFAKSESKLNYPEVNLLGTAGEVPERDHTLEQNYGAAGINIRVPVFNGGLYSARAAEASLRAQAVNRDVSNLSLLIARDVRTNWAQARDAYLQIQVTRDLVDQTAVALRLAQARYDAGLGSIVELNQAELSQTSALISAASARFDYLSTRAALNYTLGILR
jgi:outer membrane protein